jgi:hypothetical protein
MPHPINSSRRSPRRREHDVVPLPREHQVVVFPLHPPPRRVLVQHGFHLSGGLLAERQRTEPRAAHSLAPPPPVLLPLHPLDALLRQHVLHLPPDLRLVPPPLLAPLGQERVHGVVRDPEEVERRAQPPHHVTRREVRVLLHHHDQVWIERPEGLEQHGPERYRLREADRSRRLVRHGVQQHVAVHDERLAPVQDQLLHPELVHQGRERVGRRGGHHPEVHGHVSRAREVDQLRAELLVGHVEGWRRRAGRDVGDREPEDRGAFGAGGEHVDERGDLHAVRGTELDDMHDGEALGGLEDGGVGGRVAEAVPWREVDEAGELDGREAVHVERGRLGGDGGGDRLARAGPGRARDERAEERRREALVGVPIGRRDVVEHPQDLLRERGVVGLDGVRAVHQQLLHAAGAVEVVAEGDLGRRRREAPRPRAGRPRRADVEKQP